MANIDQVIARMVQGKTERVILINDQPMHFCTGTQDTPGPAISLAQLQNVAQEVTPPNLRPQLSHDGAFHFSYQSPHGPFEIAIARQGGKLQICIAPSTASCAPVMEEAASSGASLSAADISSSNGASSNGAAADGAAAEEEGPSYANAPVGSTATAAKQWKEVPENERGIHKIEHVDDLFRMMKRIEASDLHLSSGETPMIRLQGIMRKLEEYVVNDHEELKKILFAICPKRNQEQWDAEHDTDFAYELPGVARFRCNFFADRHGIGAVFRLIPSEVLTVEQLGLPKAMTDLCFLSKGLVVVTGPTGSGKSTTLAALVDYVNKHREDHIITIEDPIEFVHHNHKCLINQREVHVHTQGFKRALVAALREDQDIVLVGELRDLDTMKIAI